MYQNKNIFRKNNVIGDAFEKQNSQDTKSVLGKFEIIFYVQLNGKKTTF